MKAVILILAVCFMGAYMFGQQQEIGLAPQQGTLQKVEELSTEEQAELQKSFNAITKAQADFETTKAKVAAAHKMSQESYMEWSSWYEIDGKFILQRFLSHQTSHITW